MKPYGKELIIDLHNCDPSTFTRKSIKDYVDTLCKEVIYMEAEDLHFWDYEGDPEGYAEAPDHLKGVSAVQFIKTSSIVIHTLDVLEKAFINIFSCKEFDTVEVARFTSGWFFGRVVNSKVVYRL